MNDADLLRYLSTLSKRRTENNAEFLAPLGITPNQSEVLQVLSKKNLYH